MTTLSRRQLLGVLGGTAGVAGGRYWLWQTVNCPETVEPTHGYTNDSIDIWSEPVLNRNHTYIGEGTGVVRFSSDTRQFRLLALDGRGEPQWVTRLELQGGIGRPLVTADQVIVLRVVTLSPVVTVKPAAVSGHLISATTKMDT